MSFNHSLCESRMWKSAILLFVFVGLGFTSKFDPYNVDDDELLMAYNIDDDDESIHNNLFDAAAIPSAAETTTIDNLHLQQQQKDEPDFEYLHFRNLTILVGNTAYLKCFVKNIGNKTVSWVRHRDINLLTVGTTSYTSDIRFQSIHDADSNEWILKIRYAQVRDSGAFECQISTTPPKGYPIYLNVVEPQTTIIGGPDIFVNFGSTINLTCIVKNSPESPFAMFWTHNNIEVNYDSERGGISVITEKSDVTISYLLIQRARSSDSGTYVCSPSNASSKSVNVHITAGSNPEAMHGSGMKSKTVNSLNLLLIVVVFIYVKKVIFQKVNSISIS